MDRGRFPRLHSLRVTVIEQMTKNGSGQVDEKRHEFDRLEETPSRLKAHFARDSESEVDIEGIIQEAYEREWPQISLHAPYHFAEAGIRRSVTRSVTANLVYH